MNKIITTEETDIELDPESLTENVELNKPIFESKSKMLEAIRDLDALLDNVNAQNQELVNSIVPSPQPVPKRHECFIRVKSKNTNNEFSMNFKLIGLNQGIIERNSSELEIETSEQKILKFFAFYQNIISSKRKSRKAGLNNLKVLFSKKRIAQKKRRRLINKNDIYVIDLNIKVNGKKLKLIDIRDAIWRISEIRYIFDNNRSTCKVSLTRTH